LRSQYKADISDRLSAEIEHAFEKSHGWLDKEHFRVNAESGMYVISNDAPRVLNWTPVLQWEDLHSDKIAEDAVKNAEEFLPVNFEVSPDSFALRVMDDTMDAPIGVSFPKGTILIVDPSHIATSTSFVIAYANNSGDKKAVFKQLIHEGHKRYLKPLNPRYESDNAPEVGAILGVVRQLVMKIE